MMETYCSMTHRSETAEMTTKTCQKLQYNKQGSPLGLYLYGGVKAKYFVYTVHFTISLHDSIYFFNFVCFRYRQVSRGVQVWDSKQKWSVWLSGKHTSLSQMQVRFNICISRCDSCMVTRSDRCFFLWFSAQLYHLYTGLCMNKNLH